MATAEQWRSRAAEALIALLTRDGAATQRGMEAKLSDQRYHGTASAINPHHLTTARLRLLQARVIERLEEVTRGGGTVVTFVMADPSKAIQRIAGRKRLLDARYRSWAKTNAEWGTSAPVPAALERVIHRSLREAAPYGYRLIRPGGGEVRQVVAGQNIAGGPLDNAAYYSGLGPDGLPTAAILLPIEAKNIREWVYPRTQKLYQLLDKAARLRMRHPELPVMPVFVCRRTHYDTGRMAQQLGFHVIETWRQYVLPVLGGTEAGLRKFEEVDAELTYNLQLHEDSAEPMVRQFKNVIPKRCSDAAVRWGEFVNHPSVPELLVRMRDDGLPQDERHHCLAALADAAGQVFTEEIAWFHD